MLGSHEIVQKALPSGLPGGSAGKESTCNAGDPGIPGSGRSAGEGIATHSSILGLPL